MTATATVTGSVAVAVAGFIAVVFPISLPVEVHSAGGRSTGKSMSQQGVIDALSARKRVLKGQNVRRIAMKATAS